LVLVAVGPRSRSRSRSRPPRLAALWSSVQPRAGLRPSLRLLGSFRAARVLGRAGRSWRGSFTSMKGAAP
jgi:hypothetical protein